MDSQNLNSSSLLCSDEDIQKVKDEISTLLSFQKEDNGDSTPKVVGEEGKIEGENNKTSVKRKRKPEDISQREMDNVFLTNLYSLSSCKSKSISVGIVKSFDYLPHVMINHGVKTLFFTEKSWDSFLKHLHLFECYLINSVHGRKTAVRLADSDIEIDSIKLRGVQQIRLKDLTKHDGKIQLNPAEFSVLSASTEAVTRYLKQLRFAVPIIKDYLTLSMDAHPDVLLPASPLDTSIYNRLPQEVHMWREINKIYSINSRGVEEVLIEVQPQIIEEDEEEEEEEAGEAKVE